MRSSLKSEPDTGRIAGMTNNPPGTKASRLAANMAISQEVWAEKLPNFADRLAATENQWAALSEWHQHDVVAAVAHGYKQRPEVLDTWNGQGFDSLVRHVMDHYGVPVFSFLFGLDAEVEQLVQLRDYEDIAGAARLAVHGASVKDIPQYSIVGYGNSSKYDSSNTPPLNMRQGLRRAMKFERYSGFLEYLDFFEMDDDIILEHLAALCARMPQPRVLTLMGPLLLHAEREGLHLGECLRMWAQTGASPERVRMFVRDGVPVDYALLLTESE